MERTCSKCNTVLTKCIADTECGQLTLFIPRLKLMGKKRHDVAIPFVCTNCGYVEWYVESPENFK